MSLFMPGVPYLGPPDANWGGSVIRPPMGMVVHIAEGSYQGTIAWQKNPIANVSSYFVTSRTGEIAQMLSLDLMAWTQGAGNAAWIGVENEGFHTEPISDAQINANARIFAWLRSMWPSIPAQVTNSPSVGGLGWHGMGGVAWGNHPDCPGPPNVALLPTILARAIGGAPSARTTSGVDMIGVQDPDGGQFTVAMSAASPTGYYFTPVATGERSAALVAGGVQFADDTHPGIFGPSAAGVREQMIVDIAAAVVAKLPPSQGGSAPTLAQITAAVRAELDATGLGPR